MMLSSVLDHLVIVVRVTCRLRVVVTNGRDVFVESSSPSIDARFKFSSYVKFLLKHFFCSSYYSTRWSPTTTKSGKAWLVGRPPKLFGLFSPKPKNFSGWKFVAAETDTHEDETPNSGTKIQLLRKPEIIYFENRNGRAFERYLKPQLVWRRK